MDAYVNRTVGPPPSGFWGSVKVLVSGDFHAREQAMQQWHTANNKQDGFASFQKGMAVGSDVAGIATAGLIGARAANSAPSQTVEVYRGVHADHPDLPNAYNGQANPIGGHSNPTLHNQGDNNSIFTSWSTDRNIAVGHATQWGTTNGVLLNQNVPRSSLTPSSDSLLEFEVLRTGNVNGATPTILKR
jgi:hypothetical protein